MFRISRAISRDERNISKLCSSYETLISTLISHPITCSNLGTSLGKAPLGKFIVHLFFFSSIDPYLILLCSMSLGALNWTTAETVAVKQIQLSSIPKAELSEIMVGLHFFAS